MKKSGKGVPNLLLEVPHLVMETLKLHLRKNENYMLGTIVGDNSDTVAPSYSLRPLFTGYPLCGVNAIIVAARNHSSP